MSIPCWRENGTKEEDISNLKSKIHITQYKIAIYNFNMYKFLNVSYLSSVHFYMP